MKKINIYINLILVFLFIQFSLTAQNNTVYTDEKSEGIYKRAWEIGIGGSIFQFSRIDFTNYLSSGDTHQLNMQLRHSVIGPNLYIAHELNPHIYLDLQGSVGFTEQYVDGENKQRNLYMIGPGLQWRFGEYFNSSYIDPFVRIGVNYLKKNFDMKYNGVEGDLPQEMSWVLENIYNKDGVDLNEIFPIAFGVGMNTWLNDNFGIGMQGDYLLMPHKDVANSLQGTVRLIWRMGGKSKKKKPVVQYVEVERVVPGPEVIIEKIIEVPSLNEGSDEICELFNNIHFDFDKSDISSESNDILDEIASIMKANNHRNYLITGYTDARGSVTYNIGLSRRRAAAVIDALKLRGVPESIIKSRGVGKNISYAPVTQSHHVREGDRKVTVEIITNNEYWEFMPKRDY